jgi:hypothetical protein
VRNKEEKVNLPDCPFPTILNFAVGEVITDVAEEKQN